MESTEPLECALDEARLEACLALSRAAGWNQNAADWRLMLAIGRGWGLSRADGTLVASTLVLPYGGFAWISMVLVLPAQRRKGYASRLLRRALDALRAAGLTPVLDATPAGRAVYLQEGFHDTWGFKRYQLQSPTVQGADRASGIRPLAVRAASVCCARLRRACRRRPLCSRKTVKFVDSCWVATGAKRASLARWSPTPMPWQSRSSMRRCGSCPCRCIWMPSIMPLRSSIGLPRAALCCSARSRAWCMAAGRRPATSPR